jgi:hypothetical protein
MAVFAVILIFAGLHFAFPATRLWPLGLAALTVVTMIVSHIGKSRRLSIGSDSECLTDRN